MRRGGLRRSGEEEREAGEEGWSGEEKREV